MDLIESKQLLHCTGIIVPCEKAFKGRKIVLLYFAKSNSPACKQFLVNLKEIYTKSKKLRLKLEVIYVSFDEDGETMTKYFTQRHGGWFAVPFGDPAILVLRVAYGITKVPSLVILGEQGVIISKDGLMDYEKYGLDVLISWSKKPPT